jgi:hypothetical protein
MVHGADAPHDASNIELPSTFSSVIGNMHMPMQTGNLPQRLPPCAKAHARAHGHRKNGRRASPAPEAGHMGMGMGLIKCEEGPYQHPTGTGVRGTDGCASSRRPAASAKRGSGARPAVCRHRTPSGILTRGECAADDALEGAPRSCDVGIIHREGTRGMIVEKAAGDACPTQRLGEALLSKA